MSKVIDILQRSGSPFASFELVPPLKGSDASRLYDSLDPLMEFAPPFINITCHRDEVEYVPNADGSFTKMTLAKRPSTVAIVAAIMRRYPQLDIVPHVICGGASRSRVESELLDLHFLGIENVVALRGDALPGQRYFIPFVMSWRPRLWQSSLTPTRSPRLRTRLKPRQDLRHSILIRHQRKKVKVCDTLFYLFTFKLSISCLLQQRATACQALACILLSGKTTGFCLRSTC